MTVITVKELMEFSVEYEFDMLAHMFYWAVTTQQVRLEDDSKIMNGLEFDEKIIADLMGKNVLGLRRIKLYVATENNTLYTFYFAENVLEASSLHQTLFNQKPVNIIEAPRLMYKQMFIPDIDKEITLIEYRKQVIQFPAYIGHAEAGEYTLYRLDRQGGLSHVV